MALRLLGILLGFTVVATSSFAQVPVGEYNVEVENDVFISFTTTSSTWMEGLVGRIFPVTIDAAPANSGGNSSGAIIRRMMPQRASVVAHENGAASITSTSWMSNEISELRLTPADPAGDESLLFGPIFESAERVILDTRNDPSASCAVVISQRVLLFASPARRARMIYNIQRHSEFDSTRTLSNGQVVNCDRILNDFHSLLVVMLESRTASSGTALLSVSDATNRIEAVYGREGVIVAAIAEGWIVPLLAERGEGADTVDGISSGLREISFTFDLNLTPVPAAL